MIIIIITHLDYSANSSIIYVLTGVNTWLVMVLKRLKMTTFNSNASTRRFNFIVHC